MRAFRWIYLAVLLLSGCHALAPAPSPQKTTVPLHKPPATTPAPPAQSNLKAPNETPVTTIPSPPLPPVMVPQPPRRMQDGGQSRALQGVLASADSDQQAGRLDLAAEDLERAVRMAPQSALVYRRLAEVRLAQKRYASAEQMARKGLLFAIGHAQQASLWRLIGMTRAGLNDAEGARQAKAQADRLVSLPD